MAAAPVGAAREQAQAVEALVADTEAAAGVVATAVVLEAADTLAAISVAAAGAAITQAEAPVMAASRARALVRTVI